MDKARPPSRRKSREIALSLLYSLEFTTQELFDRKKEDTIQLIELADADDEYALRLFEGVRGSLRAIDEQIRGCSHHWRLERMNLIDRNIIRIGIFEILEQQVPVEVVINEAVEMAKVFGDSKSSSFINGILDAIAKKVKEGPAE
jgi:N utilization substance protein B